MSTLYSCLGVAISTFCAVVLAKLFSGTESRIDAPILFAIALVILSSHFGAIISVAGSLLAAVVFAFLLYSPENSMRVAADSDRSTLAWMILVSVSLSYLLYPNRNVGGTNGPDEKSREVEQSHEVGNGRSGG
jgi:K+-sensing histidine kinase KdpD